MKLLLRKKILAERAHLNGPFAPRRAPRLEALEGVTSGRLTAETRGLPGIAPEDLAAAYGQTYINAAFAYPRPNGNRFNPDEWCAWYSGFDVGTSLKEVSYHLTRALDAAGGNFDNVTHYIELHATFDDEYCDLRNVDPIPRCLHSDVSIGYPEGQVLARRLREGGRNGIVYPSVRHQGGTCLVAFWPHLVRDFQQSEIWKLTWFGNPMPSTLKLGRML
jgi:hypothetical protein